MKRREFIALSDAELSPILVTKGSGSNGLSLRFNDLHSVGELYTKDDFRRLVVTVEAVPVSRVGLAISFAASVSSDCLYARPSTNRPCRRPKVHSMTSSALASNVAGTSKPIALATLRLKTN